MATVGEVIRSLRKGQGIQAKELARRAGVSQQFLCDVERDRRTPSPKTCIALAEHLPVSARALCAMTGRVLDCDVPGDLEVAERAANAWSRAVQLWEAPAASDICG
jgi:transcriptional regulator with XRE-family HTH domain